MAVFSMRSASKARWLIAGAVLLGAAAGVRRRWITAERQRQIAEGEIRELSEVWTTANNCRLHTRVFAGTGPREYLPVVFVHGFAISSTYFMRVAERLATQFDVYAPDLPGHGKSDASPVPLNLQGYADTLRAWMTEMNIDRVCVVGHSMGAQIAVELALRAPEVVDRLVLIGPTMDRDTRSVNRALPKLLANGLYERPSILRVFAKDLLRRSGPLRPELQALMEHRIEDSLPRVAVPVLFVRGENDPLASQDWVDELTRITPGSRMVTIPGWGHAVHFSAPEQLVRAIAPFLSESRASVPQRESTEKRDERADR